MSRAARHRRARWMARARLGAACVAATCALAEATTAAGQEASPAPSPLRVDYEAHEGCPAVDVLREEILWRTRAVRVALPEEPAREVRVRVTRLAAGSRALVTLDEGAPARAVDGATCDEVVTAVGLIVALAVDPHASSAPRPPRAEPAPLPEPPSTPAPTAPVVAPTPPPAPAPPLAPAAPPLPLLLPPMPAPSRSVPHTTAALVATVDLGPAPRALLGAEVRGALSRAGLWPSHLEGGLRLSTTGSFDVGPGGATFDRVTAHLRVCERQDARGGGLSVGACLSAEGGALRGQGLRGGPLLTAQEDTVPWLGLGATPEASWHLGRVFVHASGGPVFPLVRRSFVFERPAYLVHEVPWVTWSTAVGVGVAFR